MFGRNNTKFEWTYTSPSLNVSWAVWACPWVAQLGHLLSCQGALMLPSSSAYRADKAYSWHPAQASAELHTRQVDKVPCKVLSETRRGTSEQARVRHWASCVGMSYVRGDWAWVREAHKVTRYEVLRHELESCVCRTISTSSQAMVRSYLHRVSSDSTHIRDFLPRYLSKFTLHAHDRLLSTPFYPLNQVVFKGTSQHLVNLRCDISRLSCDEFSCFNYSIDELKTH